MEDNTNQVVDPFTSLPMERGEKPIDPFTGKPMTSIKPRSTVVSSAYDIPTYGKNDYRDYNVNLRPGVDVNEQRAQNQSRAEQWRRGLTKLGTTALSVAVEGPVGLANGVGEALYHQDIDRLWNNTTGKYVDEFNEWMNTTMPIYKTKAEQEAITWREQDTCFEHFAPMIEPQQLVINWCKQSSLEIVNMCRAGNVDVGCATFRLREEMFQVLQASEVRCDVKGVQEGTVIQLSSREGLVIKTLDGAVCLDVIGTQQGLFNGYRFAVLFGLDAGFSLI